MSSCRIALVLTVSATVLLACGFSNQGALDVAAEGGVASSGQHDREGSADGASTTDAASGADGDLLPVIATC